MNSLSSETDRNSQLRQAALDIVLRSYENHKSHARFQETQRSWFFIAYFSIAGVMGAALLNRMLLPDQLDAATRAIMIIALVVLVLTGFLVGMAIVKVGVEFRRHFHQAESIIALFQIVDPCDEALQALLRSARIGTSGDESRGIRRIIAKRFGVAAIHNYLMSLLIGMEIAIATALLLPQPEWAILAFPLMTALAINVLQAYRRAIWSSPIQ